MKEKFTAHILKEDCVSFFNLCASLPQCLLNSEFERQTQNKYATIRDEEIHNKDLRKIQNVTPNFKDKIECTNSCVPRDQSHTQADKL